MEHVIEIGATRPEKGRCAMVMDYVTKRPKRAALRREEHAMVEVLSIIRQRPFHWVAVAQYLYGKSTWVESVEFAVVVQDDDSRMIRVSDADFHGDRAHVVVLSKTDARVMPQVILDYLIAGRW